MKTNLLILALATAFGLSAAVSTVQAAPGQGAPGQGAQPRSAKYRGGQGSTWKMGRNQHGFAGTYGKCRYTGFAGPNGYRLARSC